MQVPALRHIQAVQVAGGFDVADNHIVREAQNGDLVITADIPAGGRTGGQGLRGAESAW